MIFLRAYSVLLLDGDRHLIRYVWVVDPLPSPDLTYADPDSQTPLLSIPPNVRFSEGLTPDKVVEGPPLWAGQARRRRAIDAKASSAVDVAATGTESGGGGGGVDPEAEAEEPPPPPRIGVPKVSFQPSSGQQRMQVTRTAN